jgi:hypothetical protein
MSSVFVVSDTTQKLLKNFAGLSDQLLLNEGQKQYAALRSKAVLAIAELPEAWPRETAFYSLGNFLGVLSNYSTPAINFADKAMYIGSAESSSDVIKTMYRYSDPSVVNVVRPDKTFPVDNPAVELALTAELVSQLKKQSSQMDLKMVIITVKDDAAVVRVVDEKNSGSNEFEATLSAQNITVHTPGEVTGRFLVEHVDKLVDGAYTVKLFAAKRGYAVFQHKTLPISYLIAQQKAEQK